MNDRPTSELNLPVPPGADRKTTEEVQRFTRDVIAEARATARASTVAVRRNRGLLTVLYVLLFLVGLGAAVGAIVKGVAADTGAEAAAAATIAGLSAASFFSFFLARPLEALERNGIHTQWLSAVVNTYLLRLAYLSDVETAGPDLEDALADLTHDLKELATAISLGKSPQANDGELGG